MVITSNRSRRRKTDEEILYDRHANFAPRNVADSTANNCDFGYEKSALSRVGHRLRGDLLSGECDGRKPGVLLFRLGAFHVLAHGSRIEPRAFRDLGVGAEAPVEQGTIAAEQLI